MKKGIAIVLILWSFLFVFNTNAVADRSSLIEVKAQVDTAVITVGDHILYSIIIDRQKNVRVIQPGQGINLGSFEIKDYKFHEPVEKDDHIIERYDYVISVYDTGKFTIPPYPVAYFTSDTTTLPAIIEAPAIDIYVKSLLKGEKTPELKDIKPPAEIPFNYRFWLMIAGIVLLAAGLVFWGYRLWKRKQEKGYLFVPPPPPPPAHETALKALRELYAGDFLENREYKEFFSRLSEIIRTYLENRYFISAMEETTAEILGDLTDQIEQKDLFDTLTDILTVCDLIKFAKHIPTDEEIERIKTEAVDFIEQTKIVFNEPQAEETEETVVSENSERKKALPEVENNSPEEDSNINDR
ncbi:MAG: protein BatD [Calditrichaeota bacterium]|nr:protein BatD [Calditrichota bacterium]